jgi:p-hydroxybenzoic acid efflux pump subunit AaeB
VANIFQFLRFPVKLTFALLAALLLGFFCHLETPRWAVMTAAIVAGGQAFAAGGDPYAGALRHRGMLRIIGTFIGCLAALVIMMTTVRAPLLMLFICCAWTGICVWASSLIKVSNSYALGLAGYTALIIVVSADSSGALELVPRLAIERCSEIFLGIICAILADILFSPRSIKRVIDQEIDDYILALFQLLKQSMTENDHTELDKSWASLVRRSSAFDGMRDQLKMESSRWQSAGRRMKMLNSLSLTMITQAVETFLIRSTRSNFIGDDIQALFAVEITNIHEFRQYMRQARKKILEYPSSTIPKTLAAWLNAANEYLILAKGIQTNSRISSYEQQLLSREVILQSRSAETHHAMINGIRTFVATFSGVLFWLFSGWNSGSACMIMLAVVTALSMRMPNPLMMAKDFVYGMIAALPIGAVCFLWLLPNTQQSILLLSLVIAGLGLLAGILIQRRQIGTLGAFIGVLNIIVLSNPMVFSINSFFDGALGQIIGSFLAFMVILLIRDNSRSKTGRKILNRLMYAAVAALTTDPQKRRENNLPALYQQLFLLLNLFPEDIAKYRLALRLIIIQQRLKEVSLPNRSELSAYHHQLRRCGEKIIAARSEERRAIYYQQLLEELHIYQKLLEHYDAATPVCTAVARLIKILHQYQTTMLKI